MSTAAAADQISLVLLPSGSSSSSSHVSIDRSGRRRPQERQRTNDGRLEHMTVTSFVSIKGAPGVTTLACLVGATWPEGRKVMVAECDPSGGDLAARFQLSSREGWPALLAAARRSGTTIDIASHLQQLPGGLDVLVATRGLDALDASRSMDALLSHCRSSADSTWDVLIDLGRLAPDDRASAVWLEHSDMVVVCSRSDAASVVHIRERAPMLLERYPDRVRLAIVGAEIIRSRRSRSSPGSRCWRSCRLIRHLRLRLPVSGRVDAGCAARCWQPRRDGWPRRW